MKGDFTRLTFDPKKHYRGVLMQQGRVQLDSDWNEQVQIAEHRYSTFFSDFVGQSGAPAEGGMALWMDHNYALRLGKPTSIVIWLYPSPSQGLSATIEMWFRVNAVPGDDQRCILTLNEAEGFGLHGGYPCFMLKDTDWAIKDIAGNKVDDGNWHHIAWVIEFTEAANHTNYTDTRKIYLDGGQIGTLQRNVHGQLIWNEAAQAFETADVSIPPAFQSIVVGALYESGQASNYFGGEVAELRVWNTPRNIGTPPTAGLSGSESGLIRYFPFNEMDHATIAEDHSVNKINADIKGDVTRCVGPFLTGTISLSKGRYYVDGLLVDNEEDSTALPPLTKDGVYLAYLDVWTSHISAAEDETLLEPALGGPDTTTRIRTEWQLRCQRLGDNTASLQDYRQRYFQKWPAAAEADTWELALSGGEMSIESRTVKMTDNRLFRLEIHKEGGAGTATLKWSRDNGSVVARARLQADGTTLALEDPSLAVKEAFGGTQYVEVSGDDDLRNGNPGAMASLSKTLVENGCLIIDKWIDSKPAAGKVQTVRRWDSPPTSVANKIKLEADLVINFDKVVGGKNAYYRSGDYWLIPIRDGNVIGWDTDTSGRLISRKPHGVEHHFAALGLIRKQGSELNLVDNLQTRFEPLTAGNVSKLGDTVNGDLCVRGRVAIGTCDYRAPLSVTAFNGALVSFADNTCNEAWRISHNEGINNQPPVLSLTDQDGNGLTIQKGGNVGIGTTSSNKLSLCIMSPNAIWGSGISLDNTAAVDVNGNWKGKRYCVTSCRGKLAISDMDNGLDRLVIDKDGNLGIGIENPGAKLHIQQDNVHWYSGLRINNGSNDWAIVADGSKKDDTAKWLTIAPYGDYTKGLVIRDGYVGIGTKSPDILPLCLTSPDAVWGSGISLENTAAADANGNGKGRRYCVTSIRGRLAISDMDPNNGGDRLVIDKDGNVGIGTMQFKEKLNINGNISWEGDQASKGYMYIGSFLLQWGFRKIHITVSGEDRATTPLKFPIGPSIFLSLVGDSARYVNAFVKGYISSGEIEVALTSTKYPVDVEYSWMAIGVK
jgi:hypothetical protein